MIVDTIIFESAREALDETYAEAAGLERVERLIDALCRGVHNIEEDAIVFDRQNDSISLRLDGYAQMQTIGKLAVMHDRVRNKFVGAKHHGVGLVLAQPQVSRDRFDPGDRTRNFGKGAVELTAPFLRLRLLCRRDQLLKSEDEIDFRDVADDWYQRVDIALPENFFHIALRRKHNQFAADI
jgi:hypothetical protein